MALQGESHRSNIERHAKALFIVRIIPPSKAAGNDCAKGKACWRLVDAKNRPAIRMRYWNDNVMPPMKITSAALWQHRGNRQTVPVVFDSRKDWESIMPAVRYGDFFILILPNLAPLHTGISEEDEWNSRPAIAPSAVWTAWWSRNPEPGIWMYPCRQRIVSAGAMIK